jgi:RimJ/RimL family protein N-acetyltransferase
MQSDRSAGELTSSDLFRGKLVRLKAVDPQQMAEAISRWAQDSEYWRLVAGEPSYPISVKWTREWLEEELYKDPPGFTMFAIHLLDGDRLIGEIGLEEEEEQPSGDVFVAVGIGERENWGKGYGTDAMSILLKYAFNELGLERVSLTVSEYNPRAIQSYLKVGFVEEGRLRAAEKRAGHRYDLIYMGILREEWEESQALA